MEDTNNNENNTYGVVLSESLENTNASDQQNDESTTAMAKEYTLDIPRIPSLELPLNVTSKSSSIHKAIDMCGGLSKVKEAFKEPGTVETQKGLELYLNTGKNERHADIFFNEHPITGKRVPFRDDSIILKISMPKGTLSKHNGDIQASIASLDPNDYKVTPVSIVDNTIRFREMSDFQYRLDNVSSAKEFNDSFGTLDWSSLQNFVKSVPNMDSRPYENINNLIIDRTNLSSNSDFQLPPPPKFSMVGYPFLYKYKGNPLATKKSNGDSEVKKSYIKNYQLFLHDIGPIAKIPIEPHESLQKDYKIAQETQVYPGTKSDSGFYQSLKECLSILNKLFEKRPIWVKRHIDGLIPKEIHHTLKIALALVSYRFSMGPWRNTYIKLGIDPRTSPEYGKYQTEYFKIERKLLSNPSVKKNVPSPPPLCFESNVEGDIDSRFRFDGTQVPWYLMLQIDLLIGEPNIAEVYKNAKLLTEPSELTGWFTELDLVKIRRIVKYELGCLVQGNHEFNQYKLKYFKAMKFVKESLIPGQEGTEKQSTDADGDVTMDDSDNGPNNKDTTPDEEEENDDNGVATGETDDVVLEDEEEAIEENVSITQETEKGKPPKEEDDEEEEEEGDNIIDDFDITNATFQDVMKHVSKFDPELAKKLYTNLNGLVPEEKLSQDL
ncbi:transcription factor TFIIIC subunit TFC1 NDAI_0A08070 [Naumovozyma dairenensis CBS 421]|uniref:Transcription factor IIIC subunit 5 HTH domain-containing protein n=1 Tax=Naumovozyma dairenensis (strain ATCC 10597 / BCRC 20456 / CBS 421 / NBRC 0211 / NRRL Y-12639) TaxID=1071378 RepID=G0W573_NAUDC|nr:hypothetical protein NDAI_0A08070 [Naumovozyma dairenensis CBS 421]CCD22961.1 hypothetical protein NDAI_0A08070 [Naumovozyma dairenensis CBS 421]